MKPRFSLLSEMVEQQATALGPKLAFRSRGEGVSYVDLAARTRRVAAGLEAAGVSAGRRVGYLGKNSIAFYEILLGAAAAGAVLVPINWRLTASEVAWIVKDAGIDFLFVGSGFSGLAPEGCREIVVEDAPGSDYACWRDGQADPEAGHAADPEDIVIQLYTSGTTGTPKGAMLSHRALLAFRSLPPEAQPEWNRWTDRDVSLIVMPQFHIGGTGFGLQTLCAGATGFVADAFDAELVLDLIEHERLSKLFAVPSALQMILRHPRAREIDCSCVRTIIYGASPMPLELLREAIDLFRCGFVQQYGMTETSGTICVLPPEDHAVAGNLHMQSVGRALPGVDLRILGPGGKEVPVGGVGEVVVQSPTLMSGYWNLPDATSDALTTDGFFFTGDVGMIDADGYLYLRDRVKDMIVSGGENVYSAEVESVLRQHPGIRDVAAIGVPDDRWGEAVKAIVVAEPGASVEEAEVIAWARQWLAGFKLPKSIDFVDALPRNGAGKVLKRELRERYR